MVRYLCFGQSFSIVLAPAGWVAIARGGGCLLAFVRFNCIVSMARIWLLFVSVQKFSLQANLMRSHLHPCCKDYKVK